MKVVAVLGSPRKESNSAKLAEAVLKISAAQGAEIRRFWLNDLKFKGCQA
ncbi:MAG: NAD(P)H-dependent oxidoreductase, partial [Candidatus Adiutrix sp.]|nr:NAD(P)H-dependent oxidoreductase [Candidatus Adiutrix sp.]